MDPKKRERIWAQVERVTAVVVALLAAGVIGLIVYGFVRYEL